MNNGYHITVPKGPRSSPEPYALFPLDKGEVSTTKPFGGRGGARPKVISESGLYKLVMRSDKKEAKQFQDWVTR